MAVGWLPIAASLSSCAEAPRVPDLQLAEAWVRSATVPESSGVPVNSAAYLAIDNRGGAADRLIGAEFEGATRVDSLERIGGYL